MFSSYGFKDSSIISSIVFYYIAIIFTITTLNRAEIDTSIISNNLILIIAGFILLLVIPLGIASIDIVQKLLLPYYIRKEYPIGDQIEIGEISGEIISIDHISMTIKAKTHKVVIPAKVIANTKIEVISG